MNSIPSNLTISWLSGVRQDHQGRLYRIGHYPSGKEALVYLTEAESKVTYPLVQRKPIKLYTSPDLGRTWYPVTFTQRRKSK